MTPFDLPSPQPPSRVVVSRRRLTIKRIDPWSVLKVGAVVNLCIWLIVLVGFGVLWFFVNQLGLVEEACNIADTTGVLQEECSISGPGIFRNLVILGLIGAIIQTGLFVVAAFLYNTIATMVGGLQFITDDGTSIGAVEPGASAPEAAPPAGRLREKLSDAASKTRERASDADGPVGAMRQRARDLADRRRQEAEEARELERARAAARERRSEAAGPSASTPPSSSERRPRT